MSEFHGGNRIFYNRVPKCGSRGVLSTFRPLAAKLHYTFIESPIYSPHRLVNQSEVSIFLFKQKSVNNSTIYSLFSQMKLFLPVFSTNLCSFSNCTISGIHNPCPRGLESIIIEIFSGYFALFITSIPQLATNFESSGLKNKNFPLFNIVLI